MIKIIKLVSGESIIGELEAESIDPAVVYDPMVIDVYRDEDDAPHMRLVTANALSSDEYLVFEKKTCIDLLSAPRYTSRILPANSPCHAGRQSTR